MTGPFWDVSSTVIAVAAGIGALICLGNCVETTPASRAAWIASTVLLVALCAAAAGVAGAA